MLSISIPKPCNEDWNKMTPNEKGAFCQVCSKTVVDFTQMTDDEVKNYFLKNSAAKTCGHFKKSQLKESDQFQLLNKLVNNKMPYWQKFLAIAVISFSTLLTSCNNGVNREPTGKVSVSNNTVQNVTIPVNTSTGAPVAIDTNNISAKKVPKKACPIPKIIDPEPTVDGMVIMGEPAIMYKDTIQTPLLNTQLPDTLQQPHNY